MWEMRTTAVRILLVVPVQIERNGEVKRAAFAAFALDPGAAAVPFGNRFDDCQAQARPFYSFCAPFFHPVKTLKETHLVLLWDARAVIGDAKDDFAVFAFGAQLQQAAAWGVFDGVGQQIGQRLAQQGFIGDEHQFCRLDTDF